jgi:hypothetical protein
VLGAAAARGLSFAVGWLVILGAARGTLALPLGRESLALGVDLAVAVISIAAVQLLLADTAFATGTAGLLAQAALAGGLALAGLVACRFHLVRALMDLLGSARRRD